MQLRIRRLLVPVVLITSTVLAWTLSPTPFVRGLVAGIVSALLVAVGGLFAITRRMRKRLGDRLAPPPLPAGSWDYAMEAEELGRGTVSFTDFAGRVLIVNFWATWCAPCVAEMPSLGRLREATTDLPVDMACITSEDATVVRGFVEKRGIEVPVFLLSDERPDCFASRSIPATFVLDKRGMIALRHIGAARWDDESVITFIRGLAATPGRAT